MKPQDWRTFFSPQDWTIFNQEAARRGMSADDLATKYVLLPFDRIEQAKDYEKMDDLFLGPPIERFGGVPARPRRFYF